MKRSYLYLSEFNVGDKFTTLSRTVTETDVVLFAGITAVSYTHLSDIVAKVGTNIKLG